MGQLAKNHVPFIKIKKIIVTTIHSMLGRRHAPLLSSVTNAAFQAFESYRFRTAPPVRGSPEQFEHKMAELKRHSGPVLSIRRTQSWRFGCLCGACSKAFGPDAARRRGRRHHAVTTATQTAPKCPFGFADAIAGVISCSHVRSSGVRGHAGPTWDTTGIFRPVDECDSRRRMGQNDPLKKAGTIHGIDVILLFGLPRVLASAVRDVWRRRLVRRGQPIIPAGRGFLSWRPRLQVRNVRVPEACPCRCCVTDILTTAARQVPQEAVAA